MLCIHILFSTPYILSFIYFLLARIRIRNTRVRRHPDRPLSPLSLSEEREILSSFANCSSRCAKVSTGRFAFSRALTCIMRYRALRFARNILYSSCWQLAMLHTVVREAASKFQRGKFYGRSTSRTRTLCSACFIAMSRAYVYMCINAAVAVVHMHYPIIVAMTKVSCTNRTRNGVHSRAVSGHV